MAEAAQKIITKIQSPIQFIDLQAQRARLGAALDQAVLKVVHEGKYIMGPEITDLETELSTWAGVKHTLSCANGTDALGLVLMAHGVKPGDAIFVPAFTFVATAEVVAWVGATPYFVDILPGTFNMDPASLERAVAAAKADGLRPTGVIPVDLFGQPADYPALETIAKTYGMWVQADAAQSFGAHLNGKPVGSLAHTTSTSFFPAKPLGCYGDGGAVFTDDTDFYNVLKSLRVHGQGSDKYDNVRIGLNARMDTMQAAVLLQKLTIFADELVARQQVADRYNVAFDKVAMVPSLMPGTTSAWAQYTLVLPQGIDRDTFANSCKDAGVPTAIYYPIPLSQQKGYSHYPSVPGGVTVSEELAKRVISLPMHPYLDQATQDYIIDIAVKSLAI